jgi:predicted outer membrane protein
MESKGTTLCVHPCFSRRHHSSCLESTTNMLGITFAALLLVTTTAAHAQARGDARITSIVVTANQVDIDVGKLAGSKSRVDTVRASARQIAVDHTSDDKQAVGLVTTLKVAPEHSPTSQGRRKAGNDEVNSLGTLKGAAFDTPLSAGELCLHLSFEHGGDIERAVVSSRSRGTP